jgi:hypothetical protein
MSGVRSFSNHGQPWSRASTNGTYGEVVHNKTIEEVDVGISEVAQIYVFLNWGLFGLQLLETWRQ